MKPKAVSILNRLIKMPDQPVVVGDKKIMLRNGKLCMICPVLTNGELLTDGKEPCEEVLIGLDWDLQTFIAECEKVSDDDIFVINAEVALNEARRDENFKNVN